jgi:hypothetical protein
MTTALPSYTTSRDVTLIQPYQYALKRGKETLGFGLAQSAG